MKKLPLRISKFTWEAEDLEVVVTEEVTTTANTFGTVRPLGDTPPLKQQFPERTPKKTRKRRKKLASVATALVNLTK